MFSKWMESARESAAKLLTTGKDVLAQSVQQIQAASNDLSEMANAYLRDNVIKKPSDMTYISDNLIAMGYPGNPKTRRVDTAVNKADMTAYYLEARHPGHYKLFNLAEETYDTLLFHDMVENFNFHGYPAPTLGLLIKICTSVESWLTADPANVAVIHCYDGKARTMIVCACILTWMGSFNSPMEALAMCLERRGFTSACILPSQQRYLQYFDSLLQGIRPSGEGLRLTQLSITNVPDMGEGSCSPFLEVYQQDHLIYASYVKGSRSRGVVHPVNAGDEVQFTPLINLKGNIFIRVRHLPPTTDRPITLFRSQFYTGFVKLFKLDLTTSDVDASFSLSPSMQVHLQFQPVEEAQDEMEDPYEALIIKESSALWSEVLRRKESRMNRVETKQNAFVVGSSRSSKRVMNEGTKTEASRDYLNELSQLENELKAMGQNAANPTTTSTTTTSTGENAMELPDPDTMDLDNMNLEDATEPVDLDKILENYQSDLPGMFIPMDQYDDDDEEEEDCNNNLIEEEEEEEESAAINEFDLSAYEAVLAESEQRKPQATNLDYSSAERTTMSAVEEGIETNENENQSTLPEEVTEPAQETMAGTTSLDLSTELDVDAILAAESGTSLATDFDVDAFIAAEAEGLGEFSF